MESLNLVKIEDTRGVVHYINVAQFEGFVEGRTVNKVLLNGWAVETKMSFTKFCELLGNVVITKLKEESK